MLTGFGKIKWRECHHVAVYDTLELMNLRRMFEIEERNKPNHHRRKCLCIMTMFPKLMLRNQFRTKLNVLRNDNVLKFILE